MNSEFTRRNRQTKIVATLGPASTDYETIRKLFLEGVDVFRLNFSHADAAAQAERFNAIRRVEQEFNHPISILADLQGPKLRVGRFEGGQTLLTIGQSLVLDQNDALGDQQRVQLPHPEIYEVAEVGQVLLVDDGKIQLKITKVEKDRLTTEVLAGHVLKDRKGVNVPGAVLPISALTEKDRRDLEEAIMLGVDWIAMSFVQRPEDLVEGRRLINGRAGLISKIEKPAALDCLAELIELSDAVMVARGDLGVELPPEKVPSCQKRIVRMAREQGKPVIVATQMLESMIENAAPTRAEASDVATAVFDGTDAVMLSAETAAGNYPVEAVRMMNRIAEEVEKDELYHKLMEAAHAEAAADTSSAITAAARGVAQAIGAVAIVTFTTSGNTTLRAARERPEMPILCLTPNTATARRMTLSFGVHPAHQEDIFDFMEMRTRAVELAKDYKMGEAGQRIVITAGVPFAKAGTTNILHVTKLV